MKEKTYIFGAKSIALGSYRALSLLEPSMDICGFVVSSRQNNPVVLAGLSVVELASLKAEFTPADRQNVRIYIAIPEDLHNEIIISLVEAGFTNYICIDSMLEMKWMAEFYQKIGDYYPLLRDLNESPHQAIEHHFEICISCFYRDRPLINAYTPNAWEHRIQAGSALTDKRIASICDDSGNNISVKNRNYCELTSMYWMWKNRLEGDVDGIDYIGQYQYRRILDVNAEDLSRIYANDIDVVLPFPMLHEPDINEHHQRYVSESDWQAMLSALSELQPDYYAAMPEIFSRPYFYNYNLLIAKKDVLHKYCSWLFPILERTEKYSSPRGWERADRYIGYLGENLLTLYFHYHKNNYKIAHAGRIMLV
ncbi:MAG: DUF4422 domain-containing protein [Lachnospiraceae bacterium]|nr:DUF4422 domain-containing protein [Lachnospiraceae bacterium]